MPSDAIRRHLRPEETRSIPDGSVWIFNLSPDGMYGIGCRFDFVAVAMFTLAPEFKDWRMNVLRIQEF
jgi:hypothetical protein